MNSELKELTKMIQELQKLLPEQVSENSLMENPAARLIAKHLQARYNRAFTSGYNIGRSRGRSEKR
jgi:flagellar biosynthesis/type III secretory pathway protein FliH